jgi:hypothetical protein
MQTVSDSLSLCTLYRSNVLYCIAEIFLLIRIHDLAPSRRVRPERSPIPSPPDPLGNRTNKSPISVEYWALSIVSVTCRMEYYMR